MSETTLEMNGIRGVKATGILTAYGNISFSIVF
jgi:hypothetical protein